MAHEWKIRSMDEADSKAAVAAAERAKVTTAVWVGAAIREKIGRERDEVTGEVTAPDSAPAQVNDGDPISELRVLAGMARALTPRARTARRCNWRVASCATGSRRYGRRRRRRPGPRLIAAPEKPEAA